MTGMEHTIERAAQVIWSAPTADFGGVSERDAHFLARALAEAGLLAPAPLREVQAEAWDEGYRAGSQDMSDLRAGRLTFQTITSNPYRQEADQ